MDDNKACSCSYFQCGREITSKEIYAIRATVSDLGNLSRKALAETICEHLNWYTATGSYKVDACTKLLTKLESQGIVELPPKRTPHKKPPGHTTQVKRKKLATPEIASSLANITPVRLVLVKGQTQTTLWNEYIDSYHYLGNCKPIGCFLRYFIINGQGKRLGCILLAGAAKALKVRDNWIGWSSRQRLRNLGWVVNNTRFLIFNSIEVSNLASHVLGQLHRRIATDWKRQWGYRPVLLETFVDPQRFHGTCYKAANWQHLGQTTGRGISRKDNAYRTSRKMIFVKPLTSNFREQLCSNSLQGRVWK